MVWACRWPPGLSQLSADNRDLQTFSANALSAATRGSSRRLYYLRLIRARGGTLRITILPTRGCFGASPV